MPRESFLVNRFKSVGYALKGMFILVRTEASIKIQLVIALLVTFAGWYFQISTVEWCLQVLSIGLVMGIEGLNTAVEKLSDFVQPQHDKKIGLIKDISAGAVMLVSFAAVIVGLCIYLPKLF